MNLHNDTEIGSMASLKLDLIVHWLTG